MKILLCAFLCFIIENLVERKRATFGLEKLLQSFLLIIFCINFLIFLSFYFILVQVSLYFAIEFESSVLGNNYCFNNWFLSSCRSDNFRTTEKFIGFLLVVFLSIILLYVLFFVGKENWSKRITPIKSNGYRHPSKYHKIVGYYKNLIDFPTKYPKIQAQNF